MSKTFSVTVGKAYLIRAAGGSTITTEAGVTVATIPEEGTQTTVLAPVDTLVISDDNARVQQLIYGIATKGGSSTNLLETDNTWLGVNTYSNTIKIEAGNNIQFYSPTAGTSCNLFMNSHGDIVQLGTSSNNCAFNVVTNSYVSLYGNQSVYLTSGDYLTGGGYIVEAASSSAGIYANGRNNQYIKFTKNSSGGNDLAIKASTTNFYGNVDFTDATVTGLSGGGSGDVTAAGNNTFTGYNTFNGGTKFINLTDFRNASVVGLLELGYVRGSSDNTFTGKNTFNGATYFHGRVDFAHTNAFTGNNKFRGGVSFYDHVDFTHASVIGLPDSGGSGDVTAAGNNTFTGNNTFAGENTFEGRTTFNDTTDIYGPAKFHSAAFTGNVDFTDATVTGLSGGGSGDVTAAGNNTFTGYNTFNGGTKFINLTDFRNASVVGLLELGYVRGSSDNTFTGTNRFEGAAYFYDHVDFTNASVIGLPDSGGSGDVIAAGNNTFTGNNTFNYRVNFYSQIVFTHGVHFSSTSYITIDGTIDFTRATVIGLQTAQSLIITDEETNSLNIGTGSVAEGKNSLALGTNALANSDGAQTIGSYSRNSNSGCTVLNAFNSTSVTPTGSPANGSELVQLYIMAPNSPLANTYCDGEAGLGFITASYSSGAWTISSSGTKKLSELLNDNINVFSPDVSQSVVTVKQT